MENTPTFTLHLADGSTVRMNAPNIDELMDRLEQKNFLLASGPSDEITHIATCSVVKITSKSPLT